MGQRRGRWRKNPWRKGRVRGRRERRGSRGM